MNKKTILLSVLFLSAFGLSEIQAQESIVASGGIGTGTGGSVSYSVGQVAYTNISNETGSINQGVQQPFEFFIVGLDVNKEISLSMIVYPNPTSDFIKLEVESKMYTKLSYQLVNLHGKLLNSQKISSSITLVPMESLPPASYFLYVNDDKTVLKTFKIIKN